MKLLLLTAGDGQPAWTREAWESEMRQRFQETREVVARFAEAGRASGASLREFSAVLSTIVKIMRHQMRQSRRRSRGWRRHIRRVKAGL